jgi:hypothetical protein
VLLYAYATGVFSSRKIARECGLVKLGTIAVDGTKIKASASRHKAMSYQRMLESEAQLKQQIEALLDKARAADAAEKNEPELDIPAEIERRQARLEVIRAARERLESRQRELDAAKGRSEDDERKPRDKDGKPKRGKRYKREFGVPEDSAQENFTDPESRIMKCAGGGFDQCYNGHTAVDAHAQIIVAAELTNNGADNDRLPVLLQAVQDTLKAAPELALADAGFRAEDVFKQLADHRAEIIVALGREGRDDVKIDPQKYPHTAAMADKLGTDRAKAAYRRRKAIVEPPNGWIKHILGFRQFSFRGLSKVRAEWKLVCAALNLRRMGGLCAV